MSVRTNIATIFLTMALVSLAGAMTTLINNQGSIEYPFWCFAFFFILLRIKMYFDDLKIFKAVTRIRWGIVLGISSWFFWVLSAANIGCIQSSALMLAVAISLATCALLYTCKVGGFTRKHFCWCGFNIIYIILLGVLSAIPDSSLLCKAGLLIAGIAIALLDFRCSGSLAAIDDLN